MNYNKTHVVLPLNPRMLDAFCDRIYQYDQAIVALQNGESVGEALNCLSKCKLCRVARNISPQDALFCQYCPVGVVPSCMTKTWDMIHVFSLNRAMYSKEKGFPNLSPLQVLKKHRAHLVKCLDVCGYKLEDAE